MAEPMTNERWATVTGHAVNPEQPVRWLSVADLRQILEGLPGGMPVYLESGQEIGHLVASDPTDCFDAAEGTALLLIAEDDG